MSQSKARTKQSITDIKKQPRGFLSLEQWSTCVDALNYRKATILMDATAAKTFELRV